MKLFLLVLTTFLSIQAFSAETDKVSVVSCSASGTFTGYRKAFFGFSKPISNEIRDICPGSLPSLRTPEDGTEVQTSCGAERLDSGYTLTVKTQKHQNGTAVTLYLYESHFQQEGEVLAQQKPLETIIVNDERSKFVKNYDTDILTLRKSKKDFEKLVTVTIQCHSIENTNHIAAR